MDKSVKILNSISENIRRINSKVLLLKLLNQAKDEIEKYDYVSGRKSLIEACLLDRKNPTVYRGLGCIKQYEGKYNSAIRYFNMALKYSDRKEVEYTLIAMQYYLQDDLDNALKYFNMAIDENENYDVAYDGRNQTMLEKHLRIVDLQETLKKYF